MNALFSRVPCLQVLVVVLLMAGNSVSHGQDSIAILPPFLDREQRPEWLSSIRLLNQDLTVLLYQNAAAVYLRDEFVNTGPDTIQAGLSLPALGYEVQDPHGSTRYSHGLFATMLWMDERRVPFETNQSGDDVWYSVRTKFPPRVSIRANAMYWVPTISGALEADQMADTSVIPEGDRSLLIILSKASMWQGTINSATCTLILKDGLLLSDSALQIEPETTIMTDSTLQWILEDAEPVGTDDILIRYTTIGQEHTDLGNLSAISRFMTTAAYQELREYVRKDEE